MSSFRLWWEGCSAIGNVASRIGAGGGNGTIGSRRSPSGGVFGFLFIRPQCRTIGQLVGHQMGACCVEDVWYCRHSSRSTTCLCLACRGRGTVEIVWQQLDDEFQAVTAGKMHHSSEWWWTCCDTSCGRCQARDLGVYHDKPLPGETVLVRRLADAASQAIEKGLANKVSVTSTRTELLHVCVYDICDAMYNHLYHHYYYCI